MDAPPTADSSVHSSSSHSMSDVSVPSSLPFGAGVAGRDGAGSPPPNGNGGASSTASSPHKRHITNVLNPAQNHRANAPSPPKSPVRIRGAAAAAMDSSSGGGNGSSSPPVSSPVRKRSGLSSDSLHAPSSPTHSPVRLTARDRSSSGISHTGSTSSSCHSPTRSPRSHGLPPSPQTPTRLKSATRMSMSPSPTRNGVARGSPISAFYFPHGMPASPGSRLHTMSTLQQLTVTQPHGFDAAGIEQLTVSVLKLPRYVAPYVQQQCLLIQQHKVELRTLAQEARAREVSRRQLHRRMRELRRSTGRGSSRGSLGTLNAAIRDATLNSAGSGSDMSMDSTAAANGVQGAGDSTALQGLLSPTSLNADRSRGISTASTSSSVQTVLSFSAPNSPEVAAPTTTGADESLDALGPEALLTPLSISHGGASLNTSLLGDVSAVAVTEEEPEEEEARWEEEDRIAAADAEQRVLPATFQYYFSNHLEKFKDPHTRFFRVLHSAIDYLMDSPEVEGQQAMEGSADSADAVPPAATNMEMTLTPVHRLPNDALRVQPLHISSPRISPIHAITHIALPAPSAAAAASGGAIFSPNSSFLERHHFVPLLASILATHPGLDFLHATPEFEAKYSQTCIERIFFTLDSRGSGRLTLADLRRSTLLAEVDKLQHEPDINRSVQFFSYQHFYVLYCKFWELDSPDHDGFLSMANLLEYENRSLSNRICERIMEQCTRKEVAASSSGGSGSGSVAEGKGQEAAPTTDDPAAAAAAAPSSDEFPAGELSLDDELLHAPRMDYQEFIPFMLAEIDKNTPQSLAYWFRLLDLDHDHVLSLFELNHWFEEQIQKIQALSADVIQWADIVCQLMDMIKGETDQWADLPPASAEIHRLHPAIPRHSTMRLAAATTQTNPQPVASVPASSASSSSSSSAPSLLTPSSISDSFSSCHITRKDLARSHLQSYFLNLLFNLPRFLSHESRDPNKARLQHEQWEQGISEWESYAAVQYGMLVANEELQSRAAEQHQHHMDEDGDGEEHGDDSTEGRAHGDGDGIGDLDEDEDDMGVTGNEEAHSHQSHGAPDASQQDVDMEGEREDEQERRNPASHTSLASAPLLSSESREFMQRRWGVGGEGGDAAAHAAATGECEHKNTRSPVRVFSAESAPDGGVPHCFFVQDEVSPASDEMAVEEEEAASPVQPRVPAAAAVLLAQAHHPSRPSTSRARATTAAPDASHVHSPTSSPRHPDRVRREEERAYLELQRKIHSGERASSEEEEEEEPVIQNAPRKSQLAAEVTPDEEESMSMAHASPSSSPSGAVSGGSPPLEKLHLHSSGSSSPSPLVSTLPRRLSPLLRTIHAGPGASPLQQPQQQAEEDASGGVSKAHRNVLAGAQPRPGKENDAEALAHVDTAASHRRSTQGGDKQPLTQAPLSPARQQWR